MNTLIALQEGMEGLSVSVNGIGERAGNAALHNVLVPLQVLYGVELPGFRYDLLKPLSDLVELLSAMPIRPNEPAVGRNVFTHESGIHTHGVLKDPQTYEPIPHSLLGVQTRFVFGKHTGFSLLSATLERHRGRFVEEGLTLDDDLVKRVMERVKAKREEMAEAGVAEEVIVAYRALLGRIEITEEEVLDLALAMARG